MGAIQFDREAIDNAERVIQVTPRIQKFGYSNTFEVPVNLALRILEYIENERSTISLRFGDKCNAIFLSSRAGTPYSVESCSVLFNKARRSLGWPRGAALHSFRRGFTNNYIENEIDARIELGLDTSGETIAMSVASQLGHKSLGSQAAYIRDAQRRLRETKTYRDKLEKQRLSDENALLRSEIAKLRKMLS